MTPIETDEQQIIAVLKQYRDGFATMDVERLIDLWDPTYDDLVYVALEKAQPILGWDGIEAYYRALPTAMPADRVLSMHVEVVAVGVLGDVAHAFGLFRFEGEVGSRPEPFVARGRTTFLLRRHDRRWKVIHYHESAPPDARPEA